ncbi:MAG: hypothetical protein RR861_11880 [Glutamicibacter sp.]|uniref:hypothetical protein n=1 Tax=Glutamicibacter sp. TaxID=1931995 RepID=UPI002FCAF9FE
MPDNRIERLGVHDSLFSCAVGSLLQFRQPGDVDFFVVRENIFEGTERETLVRETAMTRTGIGRTLSPTH